MACILILPATLALGAFFPVVTRAYNKEQREMITLKALLDICIFITQSAG